MQIRKATAAEMVKLWVYKELDKASPTAKFFYNNITTGKADFWTIDKSYQKVTIGVGSDEPQNYRLYQCFALTCIDNRYTI